MDKPFVSFSHVSKSYDGKTLVVDDLNLDIKKGDFVTLLGPSGSGKTTCLMMLAGFETPLSGDILIDGKPIQKIPPNKRNLGMVFQDYALFPHMTVGENLAFPLNVRKVPAAEVAQKVISALAKVSLSGYENRRITQLSGGQRQRVAVARALIFEPEIILMDEPLGALDKNLREEMQFELKQLHRSLGSTFIYVTHDQSEALTMSDRIAVFSYGKIQQYDSPKALWERPQNSFIASFIGENNRLKGRIEAIEGDLCRVRMDDGKVIGASKVNVTEAGLATSISVRPERVAIVPPSEAKDAPGWNLVKGEVREVIYLGDHVRIHCQVADTSKFILKVLNAAALPGFTIGEQLCLRWQVKDCHALDLA